VSELNQPDSDERSEWVDVAVLAAHILAVPVLLVGDVRLEPLVGHLVGVLVLGVGLERRNIFLNQSLKQITLNFQFFK
jgi:hypothetical protein